MAIKPTRNWEIAKKMVEEADFPAGESTRAFEWVVTLCNSLDSIDRHKKKMRSEAAKLKNLAKKTVELEKSA
jgi:hypothetical protein